MKKPSALDTLFYQWLRMDDDEILPYGYLYYMETTICRQQPGFFPGMQPFKLYTGAARYRWETRGE